MIWEPSLEFSTVTQVSEYVDCFTLSRDTALRISAMYSSVASDRCKISGSWCFGVSV